MKFTPDKPDKPGQPEITDYDNKSVNLQWKKPQSDGGSPITHFIVQKKPKGKSDWEECGIVESLDGENDQISFQVKLYSSDLQTKS